MSKIVKNSDIKSIWNVPQLDVYARKILECVLEEICNSEYSQAGDEKIELNAKDILDISDISGALIYESITTSLTQLMDICYEFEDDAHEKFSYSKLFLSIKYDNGIIHANINTSSIDIEALRKLHSSIYFTFL